jgi:hypothetical protein
MSGYMVDADADGWDPSDWHPPCKHCRPAEYQEWRDEVAREAAEEMEA